MVSVPGSAVTSHHMRTSAARNSQRVYVWRSGEYAAGLSWRCTRCGTPRALGTWGAAAWALWGLIFDANKFTLRPRSPVHIHFTTQPHLWVCGPMNMVHLANYIIRYGRYHLHICTGYWLIDFSAGALQSHPTVSLLPYASASPRRPAVHDTRAQRNHLD